MARMKEPKNGQFDEAMQDLFKAQASLVKAQAALAHNLTALAHHQTTLMQTLAELAAQKAETDRYVADLDRRFIETNQINAERFARIEAILLEHGRILEALPDAVRERMGFKVPEQRTGP